MLRSSHCWQCSAEFVRFTSNLHISHRKLTSLGSKSSQEQYTVLQSSTHDGLKTHCCFPHQEVNMQPTQRMFSDVWVIVTDQKATDRLGDWVQVIKAGESDATRKAGSVMQCWNK